MRSGKGHRRVKGWHILDQFLPLSMAGVAQYVVYSLAGRTLLLLFMSIMSSVFLAQESAKVTTTITTIYFITRWLKRPVVVSI